MEMVISRNTISGDRTMKWMLLKSKSSLKNVPDQTQEPVRLINRHRVHRNRQHRHRHHPQAVHRLRPHHDIRDRLGHQVRRLRRIRRSQRPSHVRHVRHVIARRPDLMHLQLANHDIAPNLVLVRDQGQEKQQQLPKYLPTIAVVPKTIGSKDLGVGLDLVLILVLDRVLIREIFQVLHIQRRQPNTKIEMLADRLDRLATKNAPVRGALLPTRKADVKTAFSKHNKRIQQTKPTMLDVAMFSLFIYIYVSNGFEL